MTGEWRRRDGVSGCAVRHAKGQRGGERVRARAMCGIGCEARFRAHSMSHPYNMTRGIQRDSLTRDTFQVRWALQGHARPFPTFCIVRDAAG